MKLRISIKTLLNALPMMVLGGIGAMLLLNRYTFSASQLDYDDSEALVTPRSLTTLPQSEFWQVVTVLDGDTLVVRSGWKQVTVRLCGIDAPEISHPGKPGQPLGEAAKEKLRSLVGKGGNEVIVMSIEKDRYGRTVAEVFVKKPNSQQETFVNGEMVMSGMAYHYSRYSGRCMNRNAIEQSEAIAREKKVGVWRDPKAVEPWKWRKKW